MFSRLFTAAKEQEGMAIIGVLMAVLIFTSLCTTILIIADQESLITHHQEETLKALYAAEGGIQTVLFHMNKSPKMTWHEVKTMCAQLTSQKPSVGTAQIQSIVPNDLGSKIKFTVTGVSQSCEKVLIAYVRKPLSSRIKPMLQGFTCGGEIETIVSSNQTLTGDVLVTGPISVRDGGTVIGNIFALGNVTVETGGEVRGGIVSQGTVTVAENATVTGEVAELQASVSQVPDFPDLQYEKEYFAELALANEGHYFSLNEMPKTMFAKDLNNMEGVYFAPGNLIIDTSAVQYSGNALVVAQGNIYLHNNLLPADKDSTLALVSYGDIELHNVGALEGVLIALGALDSNGTKGTVKGNAAAGDMRSFKHDFTSSPGSVKGLEDYLCFEGIPAKLDIWRERYDIY